MYTYTRNIVKQSIVLFCTFYQKGVEKKAFLSSTAKKPKHTQHNYYNCIHQQISTTSYNAQFCPGSRRTTFLRGREQEITTVVPHNRFYIMSVMRVSTYLCSQYITYSHQRRRVSWPMLCINAVTHCLLLYLTQFIYLCVLTNCSFVLLLCYQFIGISF